MSIAKDLPEVAPFFIQKCPFCQRPNRMVINGVYREEGKPAQRYPDIGYSFCNCKNIFYTNFENVKHGTPDYDADPVRRMGIKIALMQSNETVRLVLPDPFFCEWNNDPYSFIHWSPRVHWIIWDKEQFEEEMRLAGFEIISSKRQMDVLSAYKQTFDITLKKP